MQTGGRGYPNTYITACFYCRKRTRRSRSAADHRAVDCAAVDVGSGRSKAREGRAVRCSDTLIECLNSRDARQLAVHQRASSSDVGCIGNVRVGLNRVQLRAVNRHVAAINLTILYQYAVNGHASRSGRLSDGVGRNTVTSRHDDIRAAAGITVSKHFRQFVARPDLRVNVSLDGLGRRNCIVATADRRQVSIYEAAGKLRIRHGPICRGLDGPRTHVHDLDIARAGRRSSREGQRRAADAVCVLLLVDAGDVDVGVVLVAIGWSDRERKGSLASRAIEQINSLSASVG